MKNVQSVMQNSSSSIYPEKLDHTVWTHSTTTEDFSRPPDEVWLSLCRYLRSTVGECRQENIASVPRSCHPNVDFNSHDHTLFTAVQQWVPHIFLGVIFFDKHAYLTCKMSCKQLLHQVDILCQTQFCVSKRPSSYNVMDKALHCHL